MGSLVLRPDDAGIDQIVTVDVHGAKHLLASGHRYVDVRTKEEYKKGHIDVQNCLNIPYMFNTPQGRVKNSKFIKQISSACNMDEHLVVGCQSGVRSVYAINDLLEVGFKHVKNMEGGYADWENKGLPVKKLNQDL